MTGKNRDIYQTRKSSKTEVAAMKKKKAKRTEEKIAQYRKMIVEM